ncbi:MAG: zinc-binding dehydrogenase [Candidatus Lokiarchaeota archaeon]|nr:zinc-binding dehydrogenase [Candidatus Lokiarchaeota archaeon]MBD3341796.1 zinc-binding dehydrogenase [Candidatus Lokiarchaeota archaeon]
MKGAYIEEHGELDKIQIGELKGQKIGPNEVLVGTKFAALNHIDIFVVEGWPGLKLDLPHVIGSDGSGIIKEVGRDVTGFDVGDRVTINPGLSCGKCKYCLSGKQNFCEEFTILGENRWGTFAEYFKVPEINLLKVPENFSLEKAAAAPLTFLTAWRMLTTLADLKPEEIIFIHGAGGGVAIASIQIAKYIGAKVITSTSTAKKKEKVKQLGADFVINYKENPDFTKLVYKEFTNKKGVDVVVDSVGQATFSKSVQLLKPGGKLVVPGATTGSNVELDLRYVFWKQLKILGSTMSNQNEFRSVMDLVFKGKLNPIIDKIFPLEKIIDAEKHLKNAKQFGKVLLQF